MQHQRQQQLAAQQMQQLQFLAQQEDQSRAGTLGALTEAERNASLIDPRARPDYLTKVLGGIGQVQTTPSAYGAGVFQGIGTPGWHAPAPAQFTNPFTAPPQAAPQQGGAPPAAPAPTTAPPEAAPAPPAPLQTSAALVGVGTTPQPAPAPPGGPAGAAGAIPGAGMPAGGAAGGPIAGPPTPDTMNLLDQMIGNWPMSPLTKALFRSQMAQNQTQAVQQQTAQTVGTAGAASGSTGTGPVGNATPGRLPSAGMAPPPPMQHPGGLLPPAPQPLVNPNGLPTGVAPQQQPGAPQQAQRPGLNLFGQTFPMERFDKGAVSTSFNNFWQLYRQSVNFDLPPEARQKIEAMAGRHTIVPTTDEEADSLGKDTGELQSLMSGRGIASQGLELRQKEAWRKEVGAFDSPSAEYLIGEAGQFKKEWGPNPLSSRSDYKAMKAAYDAGNIERADQLAQQLQRGLKSGLSEKTVTARLGELFKLAGQAAPGTLDGHGWLRLAQNLGLGSMFSEADAPNMVALLQGASAEKQREMLLGNFKNWESLPPDAKDAVIQKINGLGKIAGDKPIDVPEDFVRGLTPYQTKQLFQTTRRVNIEGAREKVYAAHVKVMEDLARQRANRVGTAKTDQELAQDIRHEREQIQMFQGAMKLKDYQDAAVAYSEWKRQNKNNPKALADGPQVQAGIPDSDKMRHLWGLEQNVTAASQTVTDRIHALSQQQPQQQQVPNPSGQTRQRSAAPAPAPPKATSTMMYGRSGKLTDISPIIARTKALGWTSQQTQQFLQSEGYHR